MTLRIESATPLDPPAVVALLSTAGPPVVDLETAPLRFIFAREGHQVAGAAALETYGHLGLLRSLVVARAYRKRGPGDALVTAVESDALASGVTLLVLLTQTAVALFRKRGYRKAERDAVPAEVRRSARFCSRFPASAECMTKIAN
jgi:amino-acid N-acetyltransferase